MALAQLKSFRQSNKTRTRFKYKLIMYLLLALSVKRMKEFLSLTGKRSDSGKRSVDSEAPDVCRISKKKKKNYAFPLMQVIW